MSRACLQVQIRKNKPLDECSRDLVFRPNAATCRARAERRLTQHADAMGKPALHLLVVCIGLACTATGAPHSKSLQSEQSGSVAAAGPLSQELTRQLQCGPAWWCDRHVKHGGAQAPRVRPLSYMRATRGALACARASTTAQDPWSGGWLLVVCWPAGEALAQACSPVAQCRCQPG